jgi:hypothetical protein
LRTLPIGRLVAIASHFRIPLAEDPSWNIANAVLLADPAMQAVPLLKLLSRTELGAMCRLAMIRDEGPTQGVLASLLPLCKPVNRPEP